MSDFTIRVPNTRSFLSQNIIVDNIQPLAYANDLIFHGGISTNEAYEEYIRLDASEETVDISKNLVGSGGIKCSTLDSDRDSNVFVKTNDTTLITFSSSNPIQLSGDLSLPTSNSQYIRFPNCFIRQGVAGDPAIVYFDYYNDTSTGQYRS